MKNKIIISNDDKLIVIIAIFLICIFIGASILKFTLDPIEIFEVGKTFYLVGLIIIILYFGPIIIVLCNFLKIKQQEKLYIDRIMTKNDFELIDIIPTSSISQGIWILKSKDISGMPKSIYSNTYLFKWNGEKIYFNYWFQTLVYFTNNNKIQNSRKIHLLYSYPKLSRKKIPFYHTTPSHHFTYTEFELDGKTLNKSERKKAKSVNILIQCYKNLNHLFIFYKGRDMLLLTKKELSQINPFLLHYITNQEKYERTDKKQ